MLSFMFIRQFDSIRFCLSLTKLLYPLNIPSFSKSNVPYKTVAFKLEVYDMIKELASKEKRGVSNFIEHKLTSEK